MAGRLAHLWNEWEIRILLLLSFTLQVILLALGSIRRRKGSALLRILLWLAYLMADSTAIYTLGHLSLHTRSSEKWFIAFWAPLLLLHLGGPDTITAYALEDNQLWLRHLLNLIVQVLGAAYVLYQYVASPGSLVLASVMFLTGFLKYGERTWALKRADINSMRSSLLRQTGFGRRAPKTLELDAEEVLLGAHVMFGSCQSLFAREMIWHQRDKDTIDQGIQFKGEKYMYELVEMQLSLMYDILYTKAAVIHTWYGWCIRVISPVATLTAFLLFQLDSTRDAYSRVDVIVTYVLLLGAFIVEITSLFRAIGSSWTCAFLYAQKWDWLHGAIVCLRRPFKAASRRRWLCSIGQYSLLGFCTRDMTELRSRITKKVGLEDWWNKLHYSGTTEISQSAWNLVLGAIPKRLPGDMKKARGRWILHQRRLKDDIIIPSIEDTDFDESILIWHVATDVYLCCRARDQNAEVLAKTVKELSDYMMFLYEVHPHMLPGRISFTSRTENRYLLEVLWNERHSHENQRHSHELDDHGALTPREHLARLLRRKYGFDQIDQDDNPRGLAYIYGAKIADRLLGLGDERDMLQVIAEVWIEMLCHAACYCGEVSHSKQLSSGGELVTAIWLLVEYTENFKLYRDRLPNDASVAETSTADGDVCEDLDNISGAEGEICEENGRKHGAAAEIGEEHQNARPDGTGNA